MDGLTDNLTRGCLIQVNLASIAHNLRVIRRRSPTDSDVLAVVKADAYGHGAVPVARELSRQGVEQFGVATIAEARELRDSGISGTILVMSPIPKDKVRLIDKFDLELLVYEPSILEELEQTARQRDTTFPIHLKIDTGMGRLGIMPEEVEPFLDRLDGFPRVQLVGAATHYPVADTDPEYTDHQTSTFKQIVDGHPRLQADEVQLHCSNTASLFNDNGVHGNLIRPGLALYGYTPRAMDVETDLQPALSLHAEVTRPKQVPEDFGVSYGRTYQPDADTTLGVIPLGYADGYPRSLSNTGKVLLNGQDCPIRGAVCMDMTVIELPDAEPDPPIVATLMGETDAGAIWADQLAEWADTIPYEILTGFQSRLARRYLHREPDDSTPRNTDPVDS